MSDPTQPVTATEIVGLHAQLRTLRPPARGGDTATHVAFLAAKADLLERIADQHADDWPCQHAAQARHIAQAARATAEHAATLAHPKETT
jgi:hypothetical protein